MTNKLDSLNKRRKKIKKPFYINLINNDIHSCILTVLKT